MLYAYMYYMCDMFAKKTCHIPAGYVHTLVLKKIHVYFSQQLEGPCVRFIFETASKFYLYSQYRYTHVCC